MRERFVFYVLLDMDASTRREEPGDERKASILLSQRFFIDCYFSYKDRGFSSLLYELLE